MKDGKPTGGYDRLKLKYNALLALHNKEMAKVEKLRSDLEYESSRHSELVDECNALWQHMGWFRRWTWRLKHKG